MNAPRGWIGITYPSLLDNSLARGVWRQFFCGRGWHLFDEVMSLSAHYLSCDACGFHLDVSGESPSGEG